MGCKMQGSGKQIAVSRCEEGHDPEPGAQSLILHAKVVIEASLKG